MVINAVIWLLPTEQRDMDPRQTVDVWQQCSIGYLTYSHFSLNGIVDCINVQVIR